eukprot:TRINITY_DN7531_c0_g1_i1.p1 TRINITY_DN7531_c0_g1~~TRINITY_DN7531_c0_g1_i1.p1  ORF type:complete len:148 (-),score=52.23 TRINITY_DN7531_c0_g1_i1:7-429(-)
MNSIFSGSLNIEIYFQTPTNEKVLVKKYEYEIEVERKLCMKLQMILEQYQPTYEENIYFPTQYKIGNVNLGNLFNTKEEEKLNNIQLANFKIEADPPRDYLNLLSGENVLKIDQPIEIIIFVDNLENENLKKISFPGDYY